MIYEKWIYFLGVIFEICFYNITYIFYCNSFSPLFSHNTFAHNLRSSNFGSPNCRKRCYILAVRMDIIDNLSFQEMCHFVEVIAPQAHCEGPCSLSDCHLVSHSAWCVPHIAYAML